MKTAATKVSLPVLEAFLVATQKTVTICLLVPVAGAEDREETRIAMLVEVRTLGIEALTASSIIGAGKQAILVASIIGVGAVLIAAIVGGAVNPRAFVYAVAMSISVTIPVPLAIPIPVMMATTIAVLITIFVAIFVTIFVAVFVAIPVPVATPRP
jgi:hypothetical protein